MNAKTSLLGLCGMMLVGLSACFAGSADMLQENEGQVMEFRRQIDQLKLQVKTKDEETKRLAQEQAREMEKAKKLEAQVSALEERLRLMDDLVMTKSEQIASLESQLAASREAAEAAAAAAAAAVVETMTKKAPAKKSKRDAGTPSKQAP